MSTHIAVQAAVVTMLVAKRPALAKLPIRWELRFDGSIDVAPDLQAGPSQVSQIAAELTRAMRGATSETYDLPSDDGTITRAYEVRAQPSGVRVSFCGYQRGLQPAEASAAVEGGESK